MFGEFGLQDKGSASRKEIQVNKIHAKINYCDYEYIFFFLLNNQLIFVCFFFDVRFIISAAPLTSSITNTFTIPFFGQFFKSSDNSHIWSKLFYYHMSGYGPPSLLLTKGFFFYLFFQLTHNTI